MQTLGKISKTSKYKLDLYATDLYRVKPKFICFWSTIFQIVSPDFRQLNLLFLFHRDNLFFFSRLPYTSAFLQETHRLFTISPLIGPKRALNDTVVGGYVIPKDTTVLMSTGDMHVDPVLWKDPLVFKPERFLDQDGKVVQTDHLYPFGLGEFFKYNDRWKLLASCVMD